MLTLILLLIPLVFSALLLTQKNDRIIRIVALTGAIAEFAVVLAALVQYLTVCHCELAYEATWLATLGVNFSLSLDGISLPLVLLTALLIPLITASSFRHPYHHPAAFYSLILLMEGALIGVFAASDGLLFYVFWELALIPAWFICAVWGGNDRIRITLRFFIYTFTGSLLMLVALLYIYFRTPLPHSFDFRVLYLAILTPVEQGWILAALFIAFAIKIPLFPFHTWQPDTYTEAPAPGSMLLAGIMLKMGIYGMIRLLLPLTADALDNWSGPLMIMIITGIVYASLIALRQEDMKRLIAYSSIAHVGMIAAGVMAMNLRGMQGAVYQMVSHGVNITALFMIVEMIQQRSGTRNISDLGGIASRAPKLALLFMIFLLGTIALPLTNGFVGEFLLLLGLFEYNPLFAAVAGLSVILGAVYMLWMYQRVMYGKTNPVTESFHDLTNTETAILVPLALLVLLLGIAPGLFMKIIWPDAIKVLTLMSY